jgi:Recombination endonuclease VII
MAQERAAKRLAECPAGKRWCTTCDEFLPPAQFPSKDNFCLACLQRHQVAGHLQRKYGITDEQYAELLEKQQGGCAICGSTPKKQRLHVDHNHRTGVIRGLLCLWCNHRLLGGARESVAILESAIEYLTDPPAVGVIGEVVVPKKKK